MSSAPTPPPHHAVARRHAAGKAMLALSLALGLLAGCGSGGETPTLDADARLRLARAAEDSGNRDLARTMYAEAAAAAKSDNVLQLRCAEGLARNGALPEAAALLSARLKSDPHEPELQGTLGAIQVLSGQPAQALQNLSQVVAAKPNDVKAMVNEAVALDLEHRHAEAQGLYRQALAAMPDDPVISNDLALSLLLSGHVDEARRVLLPFADTPDLPERIRINLGILQAAEGNTAEAQRLLGTKVDAAQLALLTQAIAAGATTGGGVR